MKDKKKRLLVIYIILVIFLICLVFFGIKFSGFAIWTNSRVSIDEGIRVIYDEFSGNTTGFLYLNDNQLSNITNMTLEVPNHGKIAFLENINLTKDSHNLIVDIDSNINISNRTIEINGIGLTSVSNKIAFLFFYNIYFYYPRIYFNNEVCLPSICKLISYSNRTLVYQVNISSLFRITESPYCGDNSCDSSEGESCGNCMLDCGYCPVVNNTPPPAQVPQSSSGSSGGGTVSGALSPIVYKSVFSTDKDFIQVTLKQGQNIVETIDIKNEGSGDVFFKVDYPGFENFITLSEDNFTIISKETKRVYITINAKEKDIPESYFGKLMIYGNSVTKIIPIVLEIKPQISLFDIKVRTTRKKINQGDKIRAFIDLFNMGDIKPVDVVLYYSVKNIEGKIVTFKQETLAVNDRLTLAKELEIPDSNVGDYVFYARISYKNESATSMDHFKIYTKNEMPFSDMLLNLINLKTIIIIALIIVFLLVAYFIYRRITRVRYMD